MPIILKRAYDNPDQNDGYRVLVDRLWPRGLSRDDAGLDEWMKEVAPSPELRKSFHAGRLNWDTFRKGYLSELKNHRERLKPLVQRAEKERVTLVYSASDTDHNNAVVLKQYLKMLVNGTASSAKRST
jgi:uncharacterized protein YeaO (DUF488 family)